MTGNILLSLDFALAQGLQDLGLERFYPVNPLILQTFMSMGCDGREQLNTLIPRAPQTQMHRIAALLMMPAHHDQYQNLEGFRILTPAL